MLRIFAFVLPPSEIYWGVIHKKEWMQLKIPTCNPANRELFARSNTDIHCTSNAKINMNRLNIQCNRVRMYNLSYLYSYWISIFNILLIYFVDVLDRVCISCLRFYKVEGFQYVCYIGWSMLRISFLSFFDN